ncbi:MAG: Gfo/Idh/MocA family oxidoreductase [Oscillospiraceae bacterium]|nr:Gfo/Idh/MocA family oxidoreductase [Oscillospiraceae bacterium]
MEKIAVGLIGVGSMGMNHLRVFSELSSEAALVGFYDTNKELAQEIKKKYHNVVAFDSIDNLLENVEAVSIASPTPLHCKHGLLCAEKGVHALIEKPIASSYEEGKKLCEAFAQKNLKLQIGHIERFNPAVVELKNIIDNLKVWALSFNRLSIDRRILDVSVTHDLMIHDIDILCWLMNCDIKSISAAGIINALGNNSVDYAKALITFNNGVIADLTASRITEDKVRSIMVHTIESLIRTDCIARSIDISRKATVNMNLAAGIAYKLENITERIFVPSYEPLRAQIASFIGCVRDGEKPLVSGETGLNALRIADEIYSEIVSGATPCEISPSMS